MKHRIAILGFGTVGQGLAEILISKSGYLKNKYGYEFDVVAVSDLKWGTAYNPDELKDWKIPSSVR